MAGEKVPNKPLMSYCLIPHELKNADRPQDTSLKHFKKKEKNVIKFRIHKKPNRQLCATAARENGLPVDIYLVDTFFI